jgi:hypothetical protein
MALLMQSAIISLKGEGLLALVVDSKLCRWHVQKSFAELKTRRERIA